MEIARSSHSVDEKEKLILISPGYVLGKARRRERGTLFRVVREWALRGREPESWSVGIWNTSEQGLREPAGPPYANKHHRSVSVEEPNVPSLEERE